MRAPQLYERQNFKKVGSFGNKKKHQHLNCNAVLKRGVTREITVHCHRQKER